MDILQQAMAAARVAVPHITPWQLVVPHELTSDVWSAGAMPHKVVYNPRFMAWLSPAERVGIHLHETYHIALGHLTETRRDHTIPYEQFARMRNMAMDAVIDTDIDNANLPGVAVKKSGVYICDDGTEVDCGERWKSICALKPLGKTWWQVYLQMRDDPKFKPWPEFDIHMFGSEAGDGPEAEKVRGEFKAACARAAALAETIKENARLKGDEKGGNTLTYTPEAFVLSWQDQFTGELEDKRVPLSTTWAKVHPRKWARGQIAPGVMYDTMVDTIRIGIDTSGSMNGVLARVAGELLGLFATRAQTFIRFDYDVGLTHKEVMFEPPNLATVTFKGLGGTSISQALEDLALDPEMQMGNASITTVIFTDGGDTYDEVEAAFRGKVIYVLPYGGDRTKDMRHVIYLPRE